MLTAVHALVSYQLIASDLHSTNSLPAQLTHHKLAYSSLPSWLSSHSGSTCLSASFNRLDKLIILNGALLVWMLRILTCSGDAILCNDSRQRNGKMLIGNLYLQPIGLVGTKYLNNANE